VVLLSPIVAPGQVSYPASGGPRPDGDRGLVPGYELRAMVGFIGSLSPYGATGAQTLISSVNKSGAQFAGAAAEVARHSPFRWLVVLPLADALTLPACALPTQAVVVPALHGGLATDPLVAPIISGFLAGHQVRAQSGLQDVAGTMAAAAAAWRMPEDAAPSPPCVPGHDPER
jgi:hypothetical protein